MRALLQGLVLGLVVAAGCGDGALPAPRVLSVAPPALPANELRPVELLVEGALPVRVDYGARSVETQAEVTVRFGAVPAGAAPVADGGLVRAAVPTALTPGTYDVYVDWPDGRSASLPGGFQVTAPTQITGVAVGPIANQTQGLPFTVALRVLGPDAAQFRGTVSLAINKGPLSVSRSGPFVAGERTEELVIDQPNANLVLTVTDDLGHTAKSNPFRVMPR